MISNSSLPSTIIAQKGHKLVFSMNLLHFVIIIPTNIDNIVMLHKNKILRYIIP